MESMDRKIVDFNLGYVGKGYNKTNNLILFKISWFPREYYYW